MYSAPWWCPFWIRTVDIAVGVAVDRQPSIALLIGGQRAAAALFEDMVLRLGIRERLLSAFGTICCIALLGYLLIAGMALAPDSHTDRPLTLLVFRPPLRKQSPPPPVRPKRKRSLEKGRPPKGSDAPPLHLVVPVPFLPPTPEGRQGPVPSTGTSTGSGTGSGSDGEGNGNGNGGGDDIPPRQIKGRLKYSDLPPELRGNVARIGVSVRYAVDVDGRVRQCSISDSSGNEALDRRTCDLIKQRFRFEPSRDRDGRPVCSIIEETHQWEIGRGGASTTGP